ncbi:MAG: hypothetical protein J3R72DRAFT_438699 [Linnemannia gamsii]|nr:MAG: hypothetical protein J3R72DRAFT_438699 [Linnemannia gamsii]
MASERRFQSFRRGIESRTINIEAYYHEDTGQHLVDWDDILEAFPNTTCIMDGPNLVPRARDSRRKFIEPRCIKYQHGVPLEVVGDVFSRGAESASSPIPPSSSIARTATPNMHTDRHSPSFHSRTNSTSSSLLAVNTFNTTQSEITTSNTRPVSYGGSGPSSSYLVSPSYTHNNKVGHGRNNSDLNNQHFSPTSDLPTPGLRRVLMVNSYASHTSSKGETFYVAIKTEQGRVH